MGFLSLDTLSQIFLSLFFLKFQIKRDIFVVILLHWYFWFKNLVSKIFCFLITKHNIKSFRTNGRRSTDHQEGPHDISSEQTTFKSIKYIRVVTCEYFEFIRGNFVYWSESYMLIRGSFAFIRENIFFYQRKWAQRAFVVCNIQSN